MPPEGPAFLHTQLCAKMSLRISRRLVESMACRLNQRASIIIRGQHLAESLEQDLQERPSPSSCHPQTTPRPPPTAGLSKANMTMSDNSQNGYNGNTASPSLFGDSTLPDTGEVTILQVLVILRRPLVLHRRLGCLRQT